MFLAVQFVHNFTEHTLVHSWRSTSVYDNGTACADNDMEVCVTDVNSKNFEELVINTQKVMLNQVPSVCVCVCVCITGLVTGICTQIHQLSKVNIK